MTPIEANFPIENINEIAEREAHAKEKYRPVLFIHKWWARRCPAAAWEEEEVKKM